MEEGAADKLPRERRKKRKRRKNGRQVHHFRTRRQAKHYLHLKTEKGREPPLRLPMRRDEKEDARQHRQRQEDARKERRRRRRKRVGGPKKLHLRARASNASALERRPTRRTRKMR